MITNDGSFLRADRRITRIGIVLALVVFAIAAALSLREGSPTILATSLEALPPSMRSVEDAWAQALDGTPMAAAMLACLVMIAIPIARVIGALVHLCQQRQWSIALIAAIILGFILSTFFIDLILPGVPHTPEPPIALP